MILLIDKNLFKNKKINILNIPLGLSDEEREEFLRSTPERKMEIKEPVIEEKIFITRSRTRTFN